MFFCDCLYTCFSTYFIHCDGKYAFRVTFYKRRVWLCLFYCYCCEKKKKKNLSEARWNVYFKQPGTDDYFYEELLTWKTACISVMWLSSAMDAILKTSYSLIFLISLLLWKQPSTSWTQLMAYTNSFSKYSMETLHVR